MKHSFPTRRSSDLRLQCVRCAASWSAAEDGLERRGYRALDAPAWRGRRHRDPSDARAWAPCGTRTRRRIAPAARRSARSEEHTSELQSLMRISYVVFRLKKTKNNERKMKYI